MPSENSTDQNCQQDNRMRSNLLSQTAAKIHRFERTRVRNSVRTLRPRYGLSFFGLRGLFAHPNVNCGARIENEAIVTLQHFLANRFR